MPYLQNKQGNIYLLLIKYEDAGWPRLGLILEPNWY